MKFSIHFLYFNVRRKTSIVLFFFYSSALFPRHFKYSRGYLLTFIPESSFFCRSCKLLISQAQPAEQRYSLDRRCMSYLIWGCWLMSLSIMSPFSHSHKEQKILFFFFFFLHSFYWYLLHSDESHLFNTQACLI